MSELFDTGDYSGVPADEQLEEDGGEGSDATEGGLDDDLRDVFMWPGELVEKDLA